jgi:hypothetical protein
VHEIICVHALFTQNSTQGTRFNLQDPLWCICVGMLHTSTYHITTIDCRVNQHQPHSLPEVASLEVHLLGQGLARHGQSITHREATWTAAAAGNNVQTCELMPSSTQLPPPADPGPSWQQHEAESGATTPECSSAHVVISSGHKPADDRSSLSSAKL